MVKVTFVWPHNGSRVEVTGSYDGWKSRTTLKKKSNGSFFVEMDLDPGTYEYKFIVDEQWCFDVNQRFRDDGRGNTNNYMEIAPDPTPAPSSHKKAKDAKSETEKGKNSSKVNQQQKVESSEDSSQPSREEPQSFDEVQKTPAKSQPSWVSKTLHKVASWQGEKKTDESKPAPVIEATQDKRDKTDKPQPSKFKTSVRFYQSVHKKPANTWITSSLEDDKVWKERRGEQVSIEVDMSKTEIILQVFSESKGSKPQNFKSTPFPPRMFSKLATPNSWGWQGSSKDHCYAIHFGSDEEFNQFMEILNSKAAHKSKTGTH